MQLGDSKKPIVYARAVSRMQRATAELRGKEPAKALPRYGQTIQELDLLLCSVIEECGWCINNNVYIVGFFFVCQEASIDPHLSGDSKAD